MEEGEDDGGGARGADGICGRVVGVEGEGWAPWGEWAVGVIAVGVPRTCAGVACAMMAVPEVVTQCGVGGDGGEGGRVVHGVQLGHDDRVAEGGGLGGGAEGHVGSVSSGGGGRGDVTGCGGVSGRDGSINGGQRRGGGGEGGGGGRRGWHRREKSAMGRGGREPSPQHWRRWEKLAKKRARRGSNSGTL